ncbi:MAG: ATP-binding protein [Clostridia bacterium]|nr:ATP-binding protein [Clostridia bacterium]
MQEITVDTEMEQIANVTNFVNAFLKELGCPTHVRIQLDVAVDELFGNIIRYAYGDKIGPVTIRMEAEEDSLDVVLTFIDQGIPFNPLTKEMPNTFGLKARERPIGGLGLFMVKKTMDELSYEYRDGKNILMVRKKIE